MELVNQFECGMVLVRCDVVVCKPILVFSLAQAGNTFHSRTLIILMWHLEWFATSAGYFIKILPPTQNPTDKQVLFLWGCRLIDIELLFIK